MAQLICRMNGSRGRRIAIYDSKCVITTDVSLGSILTHNALDGEKTVFYIDVQGIQFKRGKFTLGYLQLETASVQMNNRSDNMFSENTFTFGDSVDAPSNELMEKVRDYIADRIESYKYGTPANKQYLYDLVALGEQTSACQLERAVVKQVHEELARKREQEMAEKQRTEAERQQKERLERERAAEEFRRSIQDRGDVLQIDLFFAQAQTCTRILQVQQLWDRFAWVDGEATTLISRKISKAAQLERMYGSSGNSVANLLEEIRKILN